MLFSFSSLLPAIEINKKTHSKILVISTTANEHLLDGTQRINTLVIHAQFYIGKQNSGYVLTFLILFYLGIESSLTVYQNQMLLESKITQKI